LAPNTHVRQIYADGDTLIGFFGAEGTARDGKPEAAMFPGAQS